MKFLKQDEFLQKLRTYDFKKLFKEKGYSYFTNGEYNLNIIGVRKGVENERITNKFDDYIVVIYNDSNGEKRKIFDCTTEPGKYYMRTSLGNSKGTAILKPNQYKSAWQLGLHRGKYKALVQRLPVTVYRDKDKDEFYDLEPKTEDKGVFGINIHRASSYFLAENVDKYSAGCQVFKSPYEFNSFIRLCEEQRKRYGNKFTYTLINEEDL